jgi:ribosomal protein L11 methyltransferase
VPWKQLRIHTSERKVSKLESHLEGLGAISITLEDSADDPILEPALGETPLWDNTCIVALFENDISIELINQRLCKYGKANLSDLNWEDIEDKDWEREWIKDYQPIKCSDNLWICPSWMDAPIEGAVNLKLDPGLAFGTGTHPTTFQCLKWLAQQDLRGLSIIDYGCGSGILGIACLLLGAKEVIGIDIDPQALLASLDNTQRNGLPDEAFSVYLPEDAPDTKADIVLANILAGPLIELAPLLNSRLKANAKICLSGILAEQENAIIDAYSKHLEIREVFNQENWLCVIGEKTPMN